MSISHIKRIYSRIVIKNSFKTLKLIRCLESSMHSRNNFEKNISPSKRHVFLIFYVSKINFKKPRIEKKYLIKFKKSSGILFFQKSSRVSKTRRKRSPSKDSFISSIPKWISNSNETLNSSSRSEESHTSFGKFLKTF